VERDKLRGEGEVARSMEEARRFLCAHCFSLEMKCIGRLSNVKIPHISPRYAMLCRFIIVTACRRATSGTLQIRPREVYTQDTCS
jgi:hypothetical protein